MREMLGTQAQLVRKLAQIEQKLSPTSAPSK
jgi:hypothetical protein